MTVEGRASVDDALLRARADALCRALGYVGSATFFDKATPFDRDENLHVVATAFDAIGIHAVFGLSDGAVPQAFKPVVYVGTAPDRAGADGLHRRAWTQGVVPFLLVVTPRAVEVRNGFAPPGPAVAEVGFDPGRGVLAKELEDLSARSLRSSVHWKDRGVSRADAVDSRLVSAVEGLNRRARLDHPALDTRAGRALVNALIGRMIYLYVLIDRGLVDGPWMRSVIAAAGCGSDMFVDAALGKGVRAAHPDFAAEEAWAVLDGVDAAINGSVFPITRDERATIPPSLVHLVHRVIRWGEEADRLQVSFLDVSFDVLRTETISAIYERFLRIEDGQAQRVEGAFYTPPYLADFVVARVDAETPLGPGSRVVDMAAGSGVFLVAAYRRIMERNVPPGGWRPERAPEARRLLRECVFGVEKNPQAVNVCRFSLYLTMLDYVGGEGIERVARLVDDEKLLPPLDRNVVVGNAFSLPFGNARFSHVVGNPPWLRQGRRGARRNTTGPQGFAAADEPPDRDLARFVADLDRTRPVVHGRLSDAFVWLAESHMVAEDGVVGLILPTTSLVGRQSERFASALASAYAIRGIANLSYLRYHLFAGARAAATVVLARKRPSLPADAVSVYRPRRSSLPLGRDGDVWALLVSQTDLQTVRQRELHGDANGWLGPLMLGVLDRRTRSALRNWAEARERTVADFLRRSGLRIMRGGNEGDTGVAFPMRPAKRGSPAKPVNLLPLPGGPGPEVAGSYRPLFSGDILLVPRSFKGLRVLREPHAFNSSYYGVAPEARWTEARRPTSAADAAAEVARLESLAAFLGSGVVRYFASLYGATVMMDGARFERGDILALPCPFGDADDAGFRALRRSPDVDADILAAIGAGGDLKRAVADFVGFSEGYADAQLPAPSFDEVGEADLGTYVDRFQRELAGGFTERFEPTVTMDPTHEGVIDLRVSFGRGTEAGPSVDEPDGTFVAASVVTFDRRVRLGRVRKTSARFAWTVDQAVEDAVALIGIVVDGR